MVERLLERYGTRAEEVIDVLADQPSVPLENDPEFTAAEIAYFAEHEDVVHLIDVILRRTNIAFRGGVTGPLLHEIGAVLANSLGWSPADLDREIAASVEYLRINHGVTVPTTASAVETAKK